MEKNSTDGTDKKSWRDRLGIGTKEMPKLSDDFKASAKETTVIASPRAAVSLPTVPAPRPAQVVVKPAPMAPRSIPMAPRTSPKIEARVTPKLEVRPTQPANDAFAERLKSQREAAERIAEQRVLAARQKAEQAAEQRVKQSAPVNSDVTDIIRPKFVFAEEDTGKVEPTELPPLPRRSSATVTSSFVAAKPDISPLPPPRPPLGMDRPPLPPRPAVAAQQPTAPSFRPLEGVSGSYAPPPPLFPQRQYTVPPATTRPPVAPPLRQAFESTPDAMQSSPAPGPEYGDYGRNGIAREIPESRLPRPTLRGPMSGPGGLPPGPYTDDIFEQPPQRPSRRVTANDYQNAYRDSDVAYEYEQTRSSGPWVLLLLLAVVTALAGAGMWFYQTQWKNQLALPAVATQQDSAPVVQPPAESAKTVPEPAVNEAQPDQANLDATPTTGESVVQPASKKQIYDRIVGDREVLGGQLQPTEEVPTAPDTTQDATQNEPIAPISGEADAPPGNGTAGDTITDDTAPLPLPPPPGQTGTGSGEQQGLNEPPLGSNQNATTISPAAGASQAADASLANPQNLGDAAQDSDALARTTEQIAAAPQPQSLSAKSSALIEPPPVEPPAAGLTPQTVEPVTAVTPEATTAVTQTDQSEIISDEPASQVSGELAGTQTPAQQPVQSLGIDDSANATLIPAKPARQKVVKLASKKKPKLRSAEQANVKRSTDPVILAPSAGASSDTNVLYGDAPAASEATTQAAPKRRTLFDLLDNRKGTAAAAEADAPDDQVATLQPAPPRRTLLAPRQAAPVQEARPAPAQGGGSGFVAQLASFRSQAEATQEFARMKSKHPSILGGLSPVVNEVTFAGSKRYRLGVGPIGSRETASRLCSRLIQAGERDCIAKRQ